MHKLKRYSEFSLNEKMGVPSAVMPMADKVSELLISKLKDVVDNHDDNRDGNFVADITVTGEEIGQSSTFPVGTITFEATLVPHPMASLNVEGAFEGDTFKLVDGKANFSITTKVYINMLTFLMNYGDPKIFADIKKEVHSTISHELTHAYESYKRATSKKKAPSLYDTKEFIYDFVSNLIRRKGDLPEDISKILFLIYGSASYEVNARVPQMWSMIRGIKDPHERLDAMRDTPIWVLATDMEKFDADAIYNKMLSLVKNRDEPVSKEEAEETLNRLFGQIEHTYIVGNERHIESALQTILADTGIFPGSEENYKTIEMLKAHDKEYKKVSKMSALSFLKFWQRKFNKTGRDFKNRLGKLTTYEAE